MPGTPEHGSSRAAWPHSLLYGRESVARQISRALHLQPQRSSLPGEPTAPAARENSGA